MEKEAKYALLIDADNISPKYLNTILSEAMEFGEITIRRIYGDWTDPSKSSWKDVLLENSISPIQQYTYTTGKNSSDSAMIIDAMDILYGYEIDGFIIASSDSDFTRLVMRLRESGRDIIGMGESKTPAAFVKACRVFKTLDVLYNATHPKKKKSKKRNANAVKEQEREIEKSAGVTVEKEKELEIEREADREQEVAPITSIGEIYEFITDMVDAKAEEDGWFYLGELGNNLIKQYPDFDCRNYGYKKLVELVKDCKRLEVKSERTPDSGGATLVYVKLK